MILETYADYEILKENLSEDTLNYINMILEKFEEYQTRNDDIEEFIDNYGGRDVILWCEGLTSTKYFIEDMKIYEEEINEDNK